MQRPRQRGQVYIGQTDRYSDQVEGAPPVHSVPATQQLGGSRTRVQPWAALTNSGHQILSTKSGYMEWFIREAIWVSAPSQQYEQCGWSNCKRVTKTSHLFLRERRRSSSLNGWYGYGPFQGQNFFSFNFFIFTLYFRVPNFYPSFNFLIFLLLPFLRSPCISSRLHLTLVSNLSPLSFYSFSIFTLESPFPAPVHSFSFFHFPLACPSYDSFYLFSLQCPGRNFSLQQLYWLLYLPVNHSTTHTTAQLTTADPSVVQPPSLTAWPLKMRLIGCPVTSVNKYKRTLHNTSEERNTYFMWLKVYASTNQRKTCDCN